MWQWWQWWHCGREIEYFATLWIAKTNLYVVGQTEGRHPQRMKSRKNQQTTKTRSRLQLSKRALLKPHHTERRTRHCIPLLFIYLSATNNKKGRHAPPFHLYR